MLTIDRKVAVPVKLLKAEIGVRYWEDGKVGGVDDEDGTRIPLRKGDCWCPSIDLETGVIENWPCGVDAAVHYKVCDSGIYHLIGEDGKIVVSRDGYVPDMLSPGGSGYGDYVIMEIDGSGKIQNWEPDLSYFDYDED